MANRKPKQEALSDQLRAIISEHELSRYEIARQSEIDAGHLTRFVQGKTALSTASLDRLGKVLNLQFTVKK